MQASRGSRRLLMRSIVRGSSLIRARPLFASDAADPLDALLLAAQRPPARSLFSFPLARSLGNAYRVPEASFRHIQPFECCSACYPAVRVCFSTTSNDKDHGLTDTVEELYKKMVESVEAQTMPPNAWLWSLIKTCSNREDIKLLFQILQKLRTFRLSNLRIHSNFNCHLCMKISEACARAGALDYGIKALWKHNVYGITPTIGSAHYLLLHAKKHNDVKLMVKIMDVLQKNSLPLQPGTADIVFSICYSIGKWDLLKTYAKKFVKAGVKLHRTAFDIWMEFAAKMGDAQSIWQIEKIRAKHVKQHTLASGFSCAKGYLLEHNPDAAAVAILVLHQNLLESKKQKFIDELQKLINEWPLTVLKRKKKEDRKTLAESLRSDILSMVSSLSTTIGVGVEVNLEELTRQEF